MTDKEAVKRKRTSHRGNVTKLRKRMDEFLKESIHELDISDIQYYKKEMEKEVQYNKVLQEKYEELLLNETGTTNAYEREIMECEDNERTQQELHSQFLKLLHEVEQVGEYEIIEAEATNLRESTHIGERSLDIDVSKFKRDCQQFLKTNRSYKGHCEMSNMLTKVREMMSVVPEIHLIAKKKKEDIEHSTTGSTNGMDGDSLTPSSSIIVQQRRKELEVELPTFNGDPLDWQTFEEILQNLMKSRGASLSQAEKASILAGRMRKEDDRKLVRSFAGTIEEYNCAIAALTNQYGDPNRLYPMYVNKLLSTPHFTFDQESLRSLREACTTTPKKMEKLGGYNIDNIYAQACISNFSPALKNDWEQYFPRRTALPTTDQLMEYLDAKMHRVPTVKEVTYSPQDNTRSQPSHSKAKSENYKASKINVKSTTHFKCLMCNNNDHTTGKCPSFASQNVEKRWETIKSFKCCTNCLSPYHSMSKCTSIFTCQKCNKKHHTLLHKETPVKVDSGASRAKINPKLTHSKQNSNSDQVHTAVGFTVLAEAIHNDAVRKVRLQLDTGAEGSLISKSLKNDLQATTLPCDATITGVNSAQSVNEMANLTLRPIGGGKELKITGYVVNKLREVPSPLHVKEIKEKPYLQTLIWEAKLIFY